MKKTLLLFLALVCLFPAAGISENRTGSLETNSGHSSSLTSSGYHSGAHTTATAALAQGEFSEGLLDVATVSGNGLVGTQGTGKVDFSAGPHGAAAELVADVFAGIRGEGELGTNFSLFGLVDVNVKLRYEASFGAGANFHARFQASGSKILTSIGTSAAAGLGSGLNLEIETDFSGIIDATRSAYNHAKNAITSVIRGVGNFVGGLWAGKKPEQPPVAPREREFSWSGRSPVSHSRPPEPPQDPPAPPSPPPQAPQPPAHIPKGDIWGWTPEKGEAWYDGKEKKTHYGTPSWDESQSPTAPAPEPPAPQAEEPMPIADPEPLQVPEGENTWSKVPSPSDPQFRNLYTGLNEPIDAGVDYEKLLPSQVALDGNGNVWHLVDGKSLTPYEYQTRALQKGIEQLKQQEAEAYGYAKRINRSETDGMEPQQYEKYQERKGQYEKVRAERQQLERELEKVQAEVGVKSQPEQDLGDLPDIDPSTVEDPDHLMADAIEGGLGIMESLGEGLVEAAGEFIAKTSIIPIDNPFKVKTSRKKTKTAYNLNYTPSGTSSSERLEFDGLLGNWFKAGASGPQKDLASTFQQSSSGGDSGHAAGSSECSG